MLWQCNFSVVQLCDLGHIFPPVLPLVNFVDGCCIFYYKYNTGGDTAVTRHLFCIPKRFVAFKPLFVFRGKNIQETSLSQMSVVIFPD